MITVFSFSSVDIVMFNLMVEGCVHNDDHAYNRTNTEAEGMKDVMRSG